MTLAQEYGQRIANITSLEDMQKIIQLQKQIITSAENVEIAGWRVHTNIFTDGSIWGASYMPSDRYGTTMTIFTMSIE